jgi:dipeptidyl aminopeptidase/acylaminoacyl peptidase
VTFAPSDIDIRRYLQVHVAAPSNFSADGRRVLVQSDESGTSQLSTVDTEGGAVRPVTRFREPVSGAYLPTGSEIVLMKAAGGNERTQLYLVGEDGSGCRPLLPEDPEHVHRIGGVTRDGCRLAYSSNRRNGVDFDIYVVDRSGASNEMVYAGGGQCSARGFSPDGSLIAVERAGEQAGDNEMLLVDLHTHEVTEVMPHREAAFVGPPAWFPDGSTFFVASDVGRDVAAVARVDRAAGDWSYVIEGPWETTCTMNWPGTRLLVRCNEAGVTRACIVDPRTLHSVREVALPGAGVADFGFSRDGRYLAYGYSSAVEPGDAWCYDCESGRNWRLTHVSPELPPALVEPTHEESVSFDGEVIRMYVYRPARGRRSPSPVVVYLHGGPEAQYVPSFDPLIQFLVAHGCAVVAPNLRGSTGLGRRFEHLDDGRRREDVLADLAAVHHWIGDQAELDARRVALLGGSYGGYLVLAGLAFQPDRWAAGVGIAGISNLVTFLERTAEWRRPYREQEYGSLEHDRRFLEQWSPSNAIDRIRAPLMLIHGENDPRVPVDEARRMHAGLRARGLASTLLVYPDEGHGLTKRANRLDAYPQVAAFLDEHLHLAGA